MRAIAFHSMLLVLVLVNACSSQPSDDLDRDADMLSDNMDNCPDVYNPDQVATIGLSTDLGDVCDDEDADSIVDAADNCPLAINTDQIDSDGNGVGDACESCGFATKVTDLATDGTSVVLGRMATLNNMLYFRATDADHGSELWRLDTSDSSPGAEMVADIASGKDSSSPTILTALGDKLYFRAQDPEHGVELWMYEPDTGASLATDIQPGSGDAYPNWLTAMDGQLYFRYWGPEGLGLWVHDPDAPDEKTRPVALVPNHFADEARDLVALYGKLYVTTNVPTYGRELWNYDPANSTAGATLVVDIFPGIGSGRPSPEFDTDSATPFLDTLNPVVLDGMVYLNGNNGVSGHELLSFDLSSAATSLRLVADINEGPGNGYPMNMITLDSKLYFMINRFMGSQEPWFRGVDELWVFDPSC